MNYQLAKPDDQTAIFEALCDMYNAHDASIGMQLSLVSRRMNREDFAIDLKIDKDARTLTITDNGIGMTQEELEKNLGTIANSGSLKFKNENKLEDDVDIIGQFGVGFYSAFMVAKRVTVRSKAYGSDQAYQWQSEGVDGYTIEPCDKETAGTEILLEIKDDTEDETYSEFLEQYRIQGLVKKYSDYIRYPIRMDMTKSLSLIHISEPTRH